MARFLLLTLALTGCTETRAAPTRTKADAAPAFPIEHVVVIVKENHTFDNYFGTFPGAEGTPAKSEAPDETPRDLCHSHACALAEWNGGKMDGWKKIEGDLAYAQYLERDIPNYWKYARTFTLADHFFSSMLGPSFPGHMFLLAAQAGWATGNPGVKLGFPYWGCDQSPEMAVPVEDQRACGEKNVFPCFSIPSLPDVLPVSWKFYGSNFYLLSEVWSLFDAIAPIRNGPRWDNVVYESEFEKDIREHTLPAVSWLVNQDLGDEHPSIGGVCMGENWTVRHVNMLTSTGRPPPSSSRWTTTAAGTTTSRRPSSTGATRRNRMGSAFACRSS